MRLRACGISQLKTENKVKSEPYCFRSGSRLQELNGSLRVEFIFTESCSSSSNLVHKLNIGDPVSSNVSGV